MNGKLPVNLIHRAAKVCARAFSPDPLHKYFIPDTTTRLARLQALYEFRLATLNNIIVTSENLEGLAIWKTPDEHHLMLPLQVFLPGLAMARQVGWTAIRRMIGYLHRSEALLRSVTRGPYWYLDTLVVDPDFQGRGFARRLLDPVLRQASDAGQPIYLLTQNPHNIDIYAHFGFRILIELPLPGTRVTDYCMGTK